MSDAIDYLINLYNGHSAIAERVDTQQLQEIHIQTRLDDKIRQWVEQGYDVILTGNPGDGKTHLMNILAAALQHADYEKDASQRHSHQILEDWHKSKKAKRPFVLAINHAPLRELAEEARLDNEFQYLYEVVLGAETHQSEIEDFVVYSSEQKERFSDIDQTKLILIDLSQRQLLTDEDVIDPLLDKLCKLASSISCESVLPEGCQRCPIKYNVKVLSDKNGVVRSNLKEVLSLVARRGFHATMRDLIGLLAFAITGGVKCEALWLNQEDCNYYDYYNLLYRGRNRLFDALRQTFDPGDYADPKVDMSLWMREIRDGWTIEEPYQPTDLDALKVLKRRYFFEHQESTKTKLRRVLSDIEREFDDLVQGEWGEHESVERLIEMINLLYAPLKGGNGQGQGYRYRLRLWNKHRYSVGQTPGYFAMRSISSDQLTIYYPELNPKYEQALEINKDHVLLAVRNWLPGDPALRVDWEMYKALAAARQGKLIDVQPYHILRRLDLFMRSLGPEVGRVYSIETVEWSDYRQRAVVTMRVNRRKLTYQSL